MVVALDDLTIAAIVAAIAAALYGAFKKGQTSEITTTVAAAVAAPAPAPTFVMPTTAIYDPAKYGGQGPNSVPWETMKTRVMFRVSDVTKGNLLAGVPEADKVQILSAISKAEETNEYHYSIGYAHGYFIMDAVCDPVGTNEYKYQVLASSSGMSKV